MARIRTIKPEMFDDPDLGALSPLARWMFVGILTQADKRGRLFDEPSRLKLRLLGFDKKADANAILDELARAHMVIRYQVEGIGYLQVRSFEKHQRPHPAEAESTIPACFDENVKLHGEQGNYTASRVKVRRSKVDTGSLDTGSLDTGSLDTGDGVLVKDEGADAPRRDVAPDELGRWVEAFAPSLPVIRSWTEARRRLLRARWREHPSADWWRDLLQRVEASDFLAGRLPPTNGHASFTADVFWCMKPDNLAKILEGRYDNRPTAPLMGAGRTAGNQAALRAYEETLRVDRH